jgi:hypothetical protein
MLFLAVTLGFFAENLRESYIHKEKGKKYLHQLVLDLKQDTAKINFCINFKNIKEIQADSLINLINNVKTGDRTNEIYYYSRIITIREPFYGAEGTLKQLQNAGGFSIIHNDDLVEAINLYIAAKEKIYQIQDMQDFSSLQMRGASNKIFLSKYEHEMLDIHKNLNYRYFIKPISGNPPLLSYDKIILNDYSNWVEWVMTSEKYDYVLLSRLKNRAIELIDQIQKELNEH